MSPLPRPLPADTWISYLISRGGDEVDRVSKERTYHSAPALARAIANRHVNPSENRTHTGLVFTTVLVRYGESGPVVEPLDETIPFLPEYNATEQESKEAIRRITTVIESWRSRT